MPPSVGDMVQGGERARASIAWSDRAKVEERLQLG